VIMAFLLQIGEEVLPEPTSELVPSRSGREVSSLVRCPVAWCPCLVEAQVGQEGRGDTHQRPVCHCRARRALLVLAEPQPRLDVLHPRCEGPAPVVRLDQWGGRALRGIGDQPADLLGPPCSREDPRKAAQVADRQPAGSDNAVAGAAGGLRDDEGLGAAPSNEIPPLAPRLELPAGLQEVAMALAGGGQRDAWVAAGLDHGRTERLGSTQDHDLDAGGGVERSQAVGRQRGGLPEGGAYGGTRRLLHIEPDTPGDDVRSEAPRATDVWVAAESGVGGGVLQRGHRRQALPACGLLGIVAEQIHGVPRPGGQSPEPLPRLLAPGRCGVPALHQEDVVAAGPVVLGLQIAGYVSHLMPAPSEDHDHDQPAEILAMVPMTVAMQGTKALVERAGHASDATHAAILPEPMVNGR
jgi:hypothetical protein